MELHGIGFIYWDKFLDEGDTNHRFLLWDLLEEWEFLEYIVGLEKVLPEAHIPYGHVENHDLLGMKAEQSIAALIGRICDLNVLEIDTANGVELLLVQLRVKKERHGLVRGHLSPRIDVLELNILPLYHGNVVIDALQVKKLRPLAGTQEFLLIALRFIRDGPCNRSRMPPRVLLDVQIIHVPDKILKDQGLRAPRLLIEIS